MGRPADRADRAGAKAVRMSSHPGSGVIFVNAQLSGGAIGSLRLVGARIAAVGVGIRAEPGDSIVDLEGDRLLPGLINAHDHLQLNSLPRPASDGHYRHAREWISDVDARRRSDPQFAAGAAVARKPQQAQPLIAAADAAMYESKHAGRNRVALSLRPLFSAVAALPATS